MRVLYPGHRYALANLKEDGETVLQFKQDAPHPEPAGTSCQEVLRALIDRVSVLDVERPWSGNASIIQRLREVIALFEARALIRKAEKNEPLELVEVASDGHFALRDSDSRRMAETGTGSVRSTASAGPTAIAQSSSEPTP